ncbi:hypothetical protein NPIL_416621 [Nephila pilipes]|uniref:Uncharacterized protein n=1 Tax=Nephila pilipes TaxID=299642 RepID=A0A8X6P037_NEPPI|nr:hypothetical protein NPIL_416621 [Nephila pilipes]
MEIACTDDLEIMIKKLGETPSVRLTLKPWYDKSKLSFLHEGPFTGRVCAPLTYPVHVQIRLGKQKVKAELTKVNKIFIFPGNNWPRRIENRIMYDKMLFILYSSESSVGKSNVGHQHKKTSLGQFSRSMKKHNRNLSIPIGELSFRFLMDSFEDSYLPNDDKMLAD